MSLPNIGKWTDDGLELVSRMTEELAVFANSPAAGTNFIQQLETKTKSVRTAPNGGEVVTNVRGEKRYKSSFANGKVIYWSNDSTNGVVFRGVYFSAENPLFV